MLKKMNFYFLSAFSFIFNILFLLTCNKFGDIFLEYLTIYIYVNFFICCFGSLQFYIQKENNLINFNIEIKLVKILFILLTIGFIYYLSKDLSLSIVYISTLVSSLIIHLKICSQTFLNKLFSNASYLFIVSFVKFTIIFFSYLFNLEFIYSMIFINLLIILLSIKFIYKIRLNFNNKNSFNLISCMNNLFGTTTTTLDKLYVIHVLPTLSATYYLIFKIASIYQFLTEVVFRKERFEITSGEYLENKKVLLLKFSFLFINIVIFNIVVKLSIQFFQNYLDILLLDDFLLIIKNNVDSISIFFLGFLINAVSGLSYDQIYKDYLYKKVMNINIFLSLMYIVLLIFYGSSIIFMSLIFLFSQVVELCLIYFKQYSLNVK